jgi:hypothetical protein
MLASFCIRAPLYSFGDSPGERRTGLAPCPFERWLRQKRSKSMKGILLWLIGIPIPIIILLYLFGVF